MIEIMIEMKKLAILAAKEAGDLLREDFGKKFKISTKLGGELVTESDVKSEDRIIGMIQEEFPDHSIIAEELGELQRDSDYTWVIDPMDGTNNFVRHIPYFGVSIALEHKKDLILGVINIPCFDELYVAEKGKGAYLNDKRISVTKKTLKDSLLLYDSQLRKAGSRAIRHFSDLASSVLEARIFGAAAINLALIASGRAEAVIDYRPKPEDIAAGCLIVREAGGMVTDLKGTPWKSYMEDVVATNGRIHEEVLKILAHAEYSG